VLSPRKKYINYDNTFRLCAVVVIVCFGERWKDGERGASTQTVASSSPSTVKKSKHLINTFVRKFEEKNRKNNEAIYFIVIECMVAKQLIHVCHTM